MSLKTKTNDSTQITPAPDAEKDNRSKVWIARDGDGALSLLAGEPIWQEETACFFGQPYLSIENLLTLKHFPVLDSVEPGECYAAEIILKEKVK